MEDVFFCYENRNVDPFLKIDSQFFGSFPCCSLWYILLLLYLSSRQSEKLGVATLLYQETFASARRYNKAGNVFNHGELNVMCIRYKHPYPE